MPAWPPFLDPNDLAPGDRRIHPDLPAQLQLHTLESTHHPLFEEVFGMLHREFGEAREMETREVIASRMSWQGRLRPDGSHLLYVMQALTVNGICVGVRDHTAIFQPDAGTVVIHLSHVLVADAWRRKGIVSVLRTLPVATARELLRLAGGAPETPIVLFCEMEPLNLDEPANRIRRQSYERAGFCSIGRHIGYLQPDFRPEVEIEADPMGTRPVELELLFRFVGNHAREPLHRDRVLSYIEAVYLMYAASFSTREMQPCHAWLRHFRQTAPAVFPLYPPTQVP
jgi:hypothetical protein